MLSWTLHVVVFLIIVGFFFQYAFTYSTLNAPFVGELVTHNKCFSLHGFPNKIANIFQSKKVESQFSNEEYLRLKSDNQAQPSPILVCQQLAFFKPLNVKVHG